MNVSKLLTILFSIIIALQGCGKADADDDSNSAMFRGGAERTGVYHTKSLKKFNGIKWKFKTGSHTDSSPAIADGVVYFGSDDYNLYAVDINTGQEIWRFKPGYAVNSSPAVADGMVYFGCGDSNLYAVDTKTGQGIWKFKAESPINSSPAVADGVIYFCSQDDYLYALE